MGGGERGEDRERDRERERERERGERRGGGGRRDPGRGGRPGGHSGHDERLTFEEGLGGAWGMLDVLCVGLGGEI